MFGLTTPCGMCLYPNFVLIQASAGKLFCRNKFLGALRLFSSSLLHLRLRCLLLSLTLKSQTLGGNPYRLWSFLHPPRNHLPQILISYILIRIFSLNAPVLDLRCYWGEEEDDCPQYRELFLPGAPTNLKDLLLHHS